MNLIGYINTRKNLIISGKCFIHQECCRNHHVLSKFWQFILTELSQKHKNNFLGTKLFWNWKIEGNKTRLESNFTKLNVLNSILKLFLTEISRNLDFPHFQLFQIFAHLSSMLADHNGGKSWERQGSRGKF